jgi:hypothetical protein
MSIRTHFLPVLIAYSSAEFSIEHTQLHRKNTCLSCVVVLLRQGPVLLPLLLLRLFPTAHRPQFLTPFGHSHVVLCCAVWWYPPGGRSSVPPSST